MITKIEIKGIFNQEKASSAGKHKGSLPYNSQYKNNNRANFGKGTDPFKWTADYRLTLEARTNLTNPAWIYPNLVMSAHLILIAAKPNGGKTTLFTHIAGEMVKAGQHVLYVNADIGGADADYAQNHADEHGYQLLLPDFVQGGSTDGVRSCLQGMAENEDNLQGSVLIIDTLKKFADVMSKSNLKATLTLFRKLTAKGMTVIILAHTNKYEDQDGNPVFEGTGDLRADVDELIYLIPLVNADRSMVITTKPDKMRGPFDPLTFNVSPQRKVTLSRDSEEAQEQIRLKQELEADADVIECIKAKLASGEANQKELINCCKNSGIPIREAKRVIPKYDGSRTDLPELWRKSKGQGKTLIYSLRS